MPEETPPPRKPDAMPDDEATTPDAEASERDGTESYEPDQTVRRVSQRDRKRRLEPVPSLFDTDADGANDGDKKRPSAAPPVSGDVPLPDHLAELAKAVADGDSLHFELPTAPERRASTPPGERFPPLPEVLLDTEAENQPEADMPRSRRRQRPHGNWRHDLIAAFFLLASVALCGYFVAIWQNPYSVLNPLAPPTPFIQITWTPDSVAIATYEAELAQAAIIAQQPSATLTTIVPTTTAAVTVAPIATDVPLTFAESTAAALVYTMQDPGVTYRANTSSRGCEWASVAGTVTGGGGEPVDGYRVRIIDVAEPDRLNVEVFSGSALAIGPGGYELVLGSDPRERQYTIQLFDQAGRPASEPFLIFTRDSCQENVAVVNFVHMNQQTSPDG
ncbi:MAG: hypothetical protein ACOCYT_02195 [Chloroflexota bacterium]